MEFGSETGNRVDGESFGGLGSDKSFARVGTVGSIGLARDRWMW